MASSADTNQSNSTRELILAGSWLTCAVVLPLPVALWWGNQFAGEQGVQAAAVAAVLCWVGSIVALVVRTRFPKPQDVVAGTLGAMLARMVIIFGGAMLSASLAPELVKAALWGQVVFYFLLTLTVETLLAVRWIKRLEQAATQGESGEQSSLSESGAKAI